MKGAARLACGVALVALTACETTGDPRAGGLFGWSEHKARERQTTRQSAVAGAESDLARESERSPVLRQRRTATDGQITAAKTNHQLAKDGLRAEQAALVAKTQRLDEDCPTAATASRARALGRELRRKVNTIAANPSLTLAQRTELLRRVEAEIEVARAQLMK